MLRFLAIVCCLFSNGWSYDFKDPYYDDFILENIYSYQNKNPKLLKFSESQDGTCEDPLKYNCCDNLNEEPYVQLELSRIECFVEHIVSTPEGATDGKKASGPVNVFSCENIKKLQKEFVCVSQCVGRKWNMTDEAGDLLSAEVLVPIVKPFYAEQVYEDAQLEKFVKECYMEKNASATTELQCNPAAINFSYCLWRKTNLECPDAKRVTSAACEQLRDKLFETDEL